MKELSLTQGEIELYKMRLEEAGPMELSELLEALLARDCLAPEIQSVLPNIKTYVPATTAAKLIASSKSIELYRKWENSVGEVELLSIIFPSLPLPEIEEKLCRSLQKNRNGLGEAAGCKFRSALSAIKTAGTRRSLGTLRAVREHLDPILKTKRITAGGDLISSMELSTIEEWAADISEAIDRICTLPESEVLGHIHASSPQSPILISDTLSLIKSRENDHTEFKLTIRYDPRSKSNDKEEEKKLAVLRTIVGFLNSDGGTLLIGVGNKGRIEGIEQDGFADADKYALHFGNLFSTHIGDQFVPFCKWQMILLEGKSVFRIDCQGSYKENAFLKWKDEPLCFVRSGNSTKKLDAKQTVDYFRNRESKLPRHK